MLKKGMENSNWKKYNSR